MASFTVDMSGDADLVRKIEALGDQIKPIAAKVLREAAEPVLARAQVNAPVKSGRMKAALRVKKATSRQGRVRIVVTTGAGDFKGKEFYTPFVELGHMQGNRKLGPSRKHVPGKRFILGAWDSLATQTEQAVRDGFKREIEAAAKAI